MVAEEAPRVFDHPTGRWLRSGYCSRCGECCAGDPTQTGDGRFSLVEIASRQFEGACPLLRHDGGCYGCAGYGEHQFFLDGCSDHPRCPDDLALTPSCTYRFERIG